MVEWMGGDLVGGRKLRESRVGRDMGQGMVFGEDLVCGVEGCGVGGCRQVGMGEIGGELRVDRWG